MNQSEKLIRDLIAENQSPDLPRMIVRKMKDRAEHILFLERKITEEYAELESATTEDERYSEAGDCLEVFDTLIALSPELSDQERWKQERERFLRKLVSEYGLDLEKVYLFQKEKREKKGGFREGIVWRKDSF